MKVFMYIMENREIKEFFVIDMRVFFLSNGIL